MEPDCSLYVPGGDDIVAISAPVGKMDCLRLVFGGSPSQALANRFRRDVLPARRRLAEKYAPLCLAGDFQRFIAVRAGTVFFVSDFIRSLR